MRYYADVAEDAHADFTGEHWDRGKALVTLEWANLRVAIDRALTTRRVGTAERIIAATYRVSSILVRHEHAQWTTAVLDLVDALRSPLDPMAAGAGACGSMPKADWRSRTTWLSPASLPPRTRSTLRRSGAGSPCVCLNGIRTNSLEG